MQPPRRCFARVEWLSISHLNLWLKRSRNQRPFTSKASLQQFRAFPPPTNPTRVGDFSWRIRGGRGGTLAAAPVNFQGERQSFFPFRRVVAPGFGRFCAHTSASVSVLNSRYVRTVTKTSVFLEWSFLTISSSIALKGIDGTGYAASIWCRGASLTGQKSSCWLEIHATVLFLCICSWQNAIQTRQLSSDRRLSAKCCATEDSACTLSLMRWTIG